MIRKYCTLLLILLASATASAQRTTPGASFGGISFGGYAAPGDGTALLAEYGRYTLEGRWVLSADVSRMDDRTRYVDCMRKYEVSLDYMGRVFGTYSRSFSLYAGGGLFMGYCALAFEDSIPEDTVREIGSGFFDYGLLAGAEGELFLTPTVALTGSAKGLVPVNGNLKSSEGEKYTGNNSYGIRLAVGIRINF